VLYLYECYSARYDSLTASLVTPKVKREWNYIPYREDSWSTGG